MQLQQYKDAREQDLPWHPGRRRGTETGLLMSELDRIMTVMEEKPRK